MSPDEVEGEQEFLDRIPRQPFLKGAAALAMTGPALAPARQNPPSSTTGPILAYVGTYSSPQGPEGSQGNGKGIYLFYINPATGALTQRAIFPDDSNPSWLAFDPTRTHVYAGNELPTFKGRNSGSVSVFSIDRSNGCLRLLNTVSSVGGGPAYVSVPPRRQVCAGGKHAAGTVAVIAIQPNGELGAPKDVKHHQGTVGSEDATDACLGSFAISGHDAPHGHVILFDATGRFILSTDLELDRIFIWNFHTQKGTVSPNDPPSVALPSGDGPRHFTFHPSNPYVEVTG